MPKRRSSILQKLSDLKRLSVLFFADIGETISLNSNLIIVRKSRKLKKFKLLRHSNYGFNEEYEFSPSKGKTPLIQYYRKQISGKNLFSMLFSCECLGISIGRSEAGHRRHSFDALPSYAGEGAATELFQHDESDDEDDSVDRRADEFIERFYAEMRMQRQEPLLQIEYQQE